MVTLVQGTSLYVSGHAVDIDLLSSNFIAILRDAESESTTEVECSFDVFRIDFNMVISKLS